MTDEERENCICRYCAFADCCPSAYFPLDKKVCRDLRDMRRKRKTNEKRNDP